MFDIVDTEGMRCLDYSFFMRTVIGEMNEFRKALVRKVCLFRLYGIVCRSYGLKITGLTKATEMY